VLLSTGELVSCSLVTMALHDLGEPAIGLNGSQAGIRTDTSHGKARIAFVDPTRIERELDEGRIVVVAGFQGMADTQDVTTLGRGASDTTAVALAAALGADRCEIYTDVDGIYTADPRLVPGAKKLDEVAYEEMLEMASLGAKMNPRSIELGMVYDVPIVVGSSFEETPGTLIHKGEYMEVTVGEIRNRVRAVATDTNVARITLLGVTDRPGISAGIFEPLAEADVSVDVIVQNVGEDGVSDLTFTIDGDDLSRALDVVNGVATEIGVRSVTSSGGLAKVSIVGTGMQDASGYAARMFRALADQDINIETISTSEIRITCIIDEDRLADGARALHSAFELDQPDAE
jgi:aspartate kinase